MKNDKQTKKVLKSIATSLKLGIPIAAVAMGTCVCHNCKIVEIEVERPKNNLPPYFISGISCVYHIPMKILAAKYKVKEKETWESIAKKRSIDLYVLLKINHEMSSNKLEAGQIIYVPIWSKEKKRW